MRGSLPTQRENRVGYSGVLALWPWRVVQRTGNHRGVTLLNGDHHARLFNYVAKSCASDLTAGPAVGGFASIAAVAEVTSCTATHSALAGDQGLQCSGSQPIRSKSETHAVHCERAWPLTVQAMHRLPFWKAAEEKQLYDSVVVGAGLSGLSTALSCQTDHSSVLPRCTQAACQQLIVQLCCWLHLAVASQATGHGGQQRCGRGH